MTTIVTIGEKPKDPALVIKETETVKQTSFIMYCRVKDFSEFSNATRLENREFYFVELKDETQRNEMIVLDIMGRKFEMVTRVHNRDNMTYTDTTTEINKETFVNLRSLASVGYKFKYYEFPIIDTDLTWEVFVFHDNGGNDHPWVRVEVAMKGEDTIVPKLPFKITEVIIEGDSENTEEQEAHISRLWTHQWSRIELRDIERV